MAMYDITTSIDFTKLVPLNNEGKNSSVFTFYDKQLGDNFIVKKVEKGLIYQEYADFSEKNLFNESRILYKVKHPNIMEIQYSSQDNDHIYMVMPICKRGSLNTLINKRFLTVREILKYSLEFLLGLHYVHSNDLVHFDIKPTNVLINDNGKAVLTDFGLSKYVNLYGLSQPNKLYSAHIPPEAFSSSLLSNKSDIYQAGITIYRMCNGNTIFNDQYKSFSKKDEAIISGKFPDRKFYLPHIPSKLKRVINKCMNLNPDKRYDTVIDIINDLSSIDKSLDWQLEILNDSTYRIKKLNEKMTHYDCIDIIKNGTTYQTNGLKIKILDNTITKIKAWNTDDLNQTNVSKTIENFINL